MLLLLLLPPAPPVDGGYLTLTYHCSIAYRYPRLI